MSVFRVKENVQFFRTSFRLLDFDFLPDLQRHWKKNKCALPKQLSKLKFLESLELQWSVATSEISPWLFYYLFRVIPISVVQSHERILLIRQKFPKGFLTFSEGVEMTYWLKMCYVTVNFVLSCCIRGPHRTKEWNFLLRIFSVNLT